MKKEKLPLYTCILFYPGDPKSEHCTPHLWRNVNNLTRATDNARDLGILYINVYEKSKDKAPIRFVKRIWIKENFPSKNGGFCANRLTSGSH